MTPLERIRVETRPLHDSLERESWLLSPAPTVDDYRRYLEKLLGFHAPLERRLARLADDHDLTEAFARRRKTPLLVKDLGRLGLMPARPDSVPWSPWLPEPTCLGGLLGCAYVLEGATLGGKVLLRRLAPRLPAVLGAAGYLDCYGEQVGERWKQMLALLDTRLDTPAVEVAAVRAARDTFATLGRWLGESAEANVA
ncbi:MAG TPA: biliverdin-producing heme oxygenase [Polyangia bacterium]|nr:biliverdin-producing heme oxygenase [Polyangia bacterium]